MALHSRRSYRAITVLPITFLIYQSLLANGVTYNVMNLGAKPDGKTDSTESFLRAWASACASENPTTIYVPPGKYLIREVYFSGNQCSSSQKKITFRIDGTLVAPSDYWDIGNAGTWIKFDRVSGVSIYGGKLDGRGTALWACKASSSTNCPDGATVRT